MNKPITIAFVDDHEFVRKGFISLLTGYEHIKTLFEAESGIKLIRRLKRIKPDIVLLDIDMPDMNGLDVLKKTKQLYPEIKFIIVSAHYKKPFIIESIRLGAKAFLAKNCKVEEVIKAIEIVYTTGEYFDMDTAAMLEAPRKRTVTSMKILSELEQLRKEEVGQNANFKNELTIREVTIIKLILEKKTNQQIADILKVHKKTIEANRAKIYLKIGTEDILDLMKFALKNNIIEPI